VCNRPAICDIDVLPMQNIGFPMSREGVISIVEDDESLRHAMVGLFRSLGHEARGYGSAEDFLAALDGCSACVITDVELPGLSGIDMTHRLRELGCTPPVIMVTARAEEVLAAQAAASGALCLLRKPFDTKELLDCVERALGA
jgi:FixJ family two-component response regulator